MKNKQKGKQGEDLAARFLEKRGYQILERNFRSISGEIDIIALQEDTIVFAEVKNWDCYGEEDLEYSINHKKQERIIKTANVFLDSHRQYNRMNVRFDVLFIQGQAIHHLVGAFTECV
ncbi:YraN family protein [Treponema sp. J25]|uniref:YraN family protein n=1 Tax=Treponema sp. J25 TaxID=2094121 RepID=UPI00104877AE|nr:YraN family protein [Treponema sp. J25]TCW61146.1 YraN family protein [Treponema sp. J25]